MSDIKASLEAYTYKELKSVCAEMQLPMTGNSKTNVIKALETSLKDEGLKDTFYELLSEIDEEKEKVKTKELELKEEKEAKKAAEAREQQRLDEQRKFDHEIKLKEIEAQTASDRIKAELEKSKIEADTKCKELEAQLALKKLEGEQAAAAASVPVNVSAPPTSSRTIDIKKFMPMYTPSCDITLFLKQFERSIAQAEVPKSKWALHLQSLLTGELCTVIAGLSDEEACDYDVVKSKLLARFQITPDAAKVKFRGLEKSDEQTYSDLAYQMKTHFEQWLKLAKVDGDYHKLVELMCLEQYLNKCPNNLKYWLQEKEQVTTIEQAALLSDDYVTRRKVSSQENQLKTNQSRFKPSLNGGSLNGKTRTSQNGSK